MSGAAGQSGASANEGLNTAGAGGDDQVGASQSRAKDPRIEWFDQGSGVGGDLYDELKTWTFEQWEEAIHNHKDSTTPEESPPPPPDYCDDEGPWGSGRNERPRPRACYDRGGAAVAGLSGAAGGFIPVITILDSDEEEADQAQDSPDRTPDLLWLFLDKTGKENEPAEEVRAQSLAGNKRSSSTSTRVRLDVGIAPLPKVPKKPLLKKPKA